MLVDLCRGRRVLVVAPHVDDEVIGPGGTVLAARDQMARLSVVHVAAPSGVRAAEYKAIARALDPEARMCLDATDGHVASERRAVVEGLVRVIQTERPEVMFVPHADDGHADHRAVFEAAYDAALKARHWPSTPPAQPHRVEIVAGYEVWAPLLDPAAVSDITAVFERKRELVRAYASELEVFAYDRFVEALNGWRGLLHFRGGYAEAFDLRAL